MVALAWMDECIQSYEDQSSANDDFSDMSLMFYYFWTHRRDITKDEYNKGLTGYGGVLDEIISEIPTMGTDRLTRKLSVDVNKLIPRYVKDKESRTQMIAMAKRMAVEYGVILRAPEFAFEYLERPTIANGENPRGQIMERQGSARNDGTAFFERETTPPPSYNEAMGLLLLGGESGYEDCDNSHLGV
ncbi:hypothetical protein SLS64_005872 [Diaporthe eres]|uniref:Uncharacterized protein n=1 Tax=Diaporthe eres TaxID=83184 RepID=A0ABR1NY45_DIAER